MQFPSVMKIHVARKLELTDHVVNYHTSLNTYSICRETITSVVFRLKKVYVVTACLAKL